MFLTVLESNRARFLFHHLKEIASPLNGLVKWIAFRILTAAFLNDFS